MRKLLAAAVLCPLVLAACGGGDDSSATNGGSGGAPLAIAADPGGDLAYTEDSLTAEAGQTEITLTNDSTLPHDVVVERDGDEIARTDVVTGDSASVSADLTAGTYTFYCSVGGHRQAGMEGTLSVD